jgi:uncharacterized phage infection (PIP) family protein YhgE
MDDTQPISVTIMANLGGIYFWTQRDYNSLVQQLATLQSSVNSLSTIVTLLTNRVQSSFAQITTEESKIMAALDDLQTQVAQNTSLEQSAVTLIQGIAKQLQDAVENNDSSALQALASQLNTSAAALGAAITANTTPAPTPAPTPDPNAPQVNPEVAAHHR